MANILLMEDYPGLQRVYSMILKSAGHTVHVASNGKEGLMLAENTPIDLILVDILMPIMGGVEFMQTYDQKSNPGVKLIVLTNIHDDDLIKKVKKLGARNYIIKADTEPQEVIRIINETLDETEPTRKRFSFKR